MTAAEPSTWAALEDAVSSQVKLTSWSSDDTFVRRGWYPSEFSFLLRWCLSSDPDDFGSPPGEPAGQFDITAPADLINTLATIVPRCEVNDAKPYFDRAWAG